MVSTHATDCDETCIMCIVCRANVHRVYIYAGGRLRVWGTLWATCSNEWCWSGVNAHTVKQLVTIITSSKLDLPFIPNSATQGRGGWKSGLRVWTYVSVQIVLQSNTCMWRECWAATLQITVSSRCVCVCACVCLCVCLVCVAVGVLLTCPSSDACVYAAVHVSHNCAQSARSERQGLVLTVASTGWTKLTRYVATSKIIYAQIGERKAEGIANVTHNPSCTSRICASVEHEIQL